MRIVHIATGEPWTGEPLPHPRRAGRAVRVAPAAALLWSDADLAAHGLRREAEPEPTPIPTQPPLEARVLRRLVERVPEAERTAEMRALRTAFDAEPGALSE